MASGPVTSWKIDGEKWKQCQTLFFWAPKSLQMVTAAMKLKRRLLLGRKVMTTLESILKSRDITWPTKVHLIKVFPVVMYGCESWTEKKAEHCEELMLLNCGVGEDSRESLGLKEIQPAHPKGAQPRVFIGRTDAEAETPILWPPDVKS